MLKYKKLNVFKLTLLSISAIVSVKSLPLFSEVGFSIIFFLIVSALFFFIPISMVIAELSSTWPDDGGCYFWIKKAYGESIAFFVMWAYWMESIIWFPTMLIFILAMFAHTISPLYPGLEKNTYFIVIGIFFIFWSLTYFNFRGINFSTNLSSIGVFFGTILPILIIIFCGIYWIISGYEINIKFNLISLIPDFNFDTLVFFSGILLGFSGIEIISFYVNYVENPQKDIAKSVFLSTFIILLIYSFGSLSISIVVPKSDICLASGIIQALKIFFFKLNLSFIIPVLAFLLLIGALSGMNTWIIGPVQGIFVTSRDGFLPKSLCVMNSNNVPKNLLILQAIIGSTLSAIFFLYINSVNGLVWIFICLSFQFASLVYIMLFFSLLKLRDNYPNLLRPYKMPYSKLLCYTGISLCLFTFLISYVQPVDINIENRRFYSFLLIFSFLLLVIPSIFFVFLKKHKDSLN